jgi:hypothetical protein
MQPCKRIRHGKEVIKGRCEGRKRALAICRVGDRREEGE